MKRNLFSSFIFILLLTVSACSGTNLVDQFRANQSAESGALEVRAIQHLYDGSDGEITPEGTKVFTNDLGYEVTLVMARLHFHSLLLISSGFDPQCLGGQDQEVMLHSDLDLMGEDLLTTHLATASIPRAAFCEYILQLGVHDHAAVKFAHDDVPMEEEVGHVDHADGGPAFHLMGEWSNDAESGIFEFMGMDPVEMQKVFKAIENGEVVDHALHFHGGEGLINILIGTKYDVLFDGVDFHDTTANLNQIYENLPVAVHQHTGGHHGSAGDLGGGHDHP